eukprot:GHUV01007991.1.p4 GENE.GHUV01007991.1~~GHUV01007991.1.p4  ORF type:complete len:120 (+),score=15.74 GHUV01007991.1:1485-1844(+)
MADSTSSRQQTIAHYVQKIRQGESAKWEKDELLDVIYWFKQIIAILFGLLWGMGQITGLVGFASFILFNVLLTVAAYKSILGIDEEEYGGHQDLVMEGLPGSIPGFLLTWILTYTYLHT